MRPFYEYRWNDLNWFGRVMVRLHYERYGNDRLFTSMERRLILRWGINDASIIETRPSVAVHGENQGEGDRASVTQNRRDL